MSTVLPALALAAAAQHGQAAVLTVGANGTYATIQAAVDAAVTAGGSNEVRLQEGFFGENVSVTSSMTWGSLEISGGWDATFSARSGNHDLTVVDGGAAGSVFEISNTGGMVDLVGFTITNGLAAAGGGVAIMISNGAQVTVRGCRVSANSTTGALGSGPGGGLGAELTGSSRLLLLGNEFDLNIATGTSGGCVGGGVYVAAVENAYARVQGNWIALNVAVTPTYGQSTGGGLSLEVTGTATADVLDNFIAGNQTDGIGVSAGTGASIMVVSGATVTARRNLLVRNVDNKGSVPEPEQLLVACTGSGVAFVTDTLAAGGDSRGVRLIAFDTCNMLASNLTAAGNAGTGIDFSGSGVATSTLYNSIAYGNGVDTTDNGMVGTGSNLIGIDPGFVNPAGDDYSLQAGSPAVDAGDNGAPGGLGPTDALYCDRIQNYFVDQGAYEWGSVLGDGFESGTVGWPWSAMVE